MECLSAVMNLQMEVKQYMPKAESEQRLGAKL
jgi:hypothetical protein